MPEQVQPQRRASTSASPTAKSPDSNVSPRTQAAQPVSQPGDYFSTRRDGNNKKNNGTPGGVKFASLPTTTSRSAQIFDQNSPNFHRGSIASSASPATTAQSPDEQGDRGSLRRASDASFSLSQPDYSLSRKSSVASVSFRPPQDPSLPQGAQRKTDGQRLRASSPEPVR
ncbi:hypothetical protein CONLIGDRAFT_640505 [Coniochaeta ligniaria NRRL 30616]|uniref:Uncharacterized protein n=1 Tax=Coniochaeta ligniaria NRRL 30616 TaxID=1408157 RepID=A0A1J7J1W8_9PEZI|nr:hypothetical protein CONLIGDRAFT_640505 [Coniochaeta ligniaria NRRL 30616]